MVAVGKTGNPRTASSKTADSLTGTEVERSNERQGDSKMDNRTRFFFEFSFRFLCSVSFTSFLPSSGLWFVSGLGYHSIPS